MTEMDTEGNNDSIVDRMKGLEVRGKSGMSLRFSGWRDKDVIYCNRDKDYGFEGKIRNLNPNRDVQEAIGNTEQSVSKERSEKEAKHRLVAWMPQHSKGVEDEGRAVDNRLPNTSTQRGIQEGP